MTDTTNPTPVEWNREDYKAATAKLRDGMGDFGYLPGPAWQKLLVPAMQRVRNQRIARDNAQGMTSRTVKPMRPLQLSRRGPG